MNNEGVDRQRQKINEFMQLFPLTAAIAGLSIGELGRYFNEGQMEVRSSTLRAAFKLAQQLVPDVIRLMQLLPVAVEIAGLPPADPHKHFNEGQLEVRTATLRAAFKAAHQLVIAVARAEPGSGG